MARSAWDTLTLPPAGHRGGVRGAARRTTPAREKASR